MVARAEEQARGTVERAEEQARKLSTEAEQRLRDEVSRLESARGQLATDVENMARHLESERNRLRAGPLGRLEVGGRERATRQLADGPSSEECQPIPPHVLRPARPSPRAPRPPAATTPRSSTCAVHPEAPVLPVVAPPQPGPRHRAVSPAWPRCTG